MGLEKGSGATSISGLSDVVIATPLNGDVLTYETASAKWKNKPSGGGSPGGADKQIQFNNATAFGGSANLTWDNGTKAFGITGSAAMTAGSASTIALTLTAASAQTADLFQQYDASGNIVIRTTPQGGIYAGSGILAKAAMEQISNGATVTYPRTGTVALNSLETLLTGTSTAFLKEIKPGDRIRFAATGQNGVTATGAYQGYASLWKFSIDAPLSHGLLNNDLIVIKNTSNPAVLPNGTYYISGAYSAHVEFYVYGVSDGSVTCDFTALKVFDIIAVLNDTQAYIDRQSVSGFSYSGVSYVKIYGGGSLSQTDGASNSNSIFMCTDGVASIVAQGSGDISYFTAYAQAGKNAAFCGVNHGARGTYESCMGFFAGVTVAPDSPIDAMFNIGVTNQGSNSWFLRAAYDTYIAANSSAQTLGFYKPITPSATTNVALIVKGLSAQTADLLQLQDSASAVNYAFTAVNATNHQAKFNAKDYYGKTGTIAFQSYNVEAGWWAITSGLGGTGGKIATFYDGYNYCVDIGTSGRASYFWYGVAVDTEQAYFLGDTGTDGTWRIIRSTTDLVIQRRESTVWVTKSTIAA